MTPCLDADTLDQLLAGTLSDNQAAALRFHLNECGRCRQRLDHLSDDAELRSWTSEAKPGQEHVNPPAGSRLSRLIADLCSGARVSSGPTGGDTASDLSLSFLEPPRCPGDLGSLGPYRIQAELARGGMGVVLRGFDEALKRSVAIKVIRPQFSTEATRARLQYEAQAAASLRHDHIVQVYAVATTNDGLPYLVMEFLEGPTLADRIRTKPGLTPREAARVVAEVAEGLAAAHAAGLVHRDIKPSNILLEAGTGRAKVVDFGLARLKELPTGATHEGVIGGTPAYMSPEQVQGAAQVDARTDVYSLGITLYEALTGEAPFRGKAHLILHQVLHDEPPSPRRLNDAVPPDLETVCLKAMAKEPARRYATASSLAEDLRRWLRGEPVHVRPVSRAERGWRWCKRNPAPAALAALLVLVISGSFLAVLAEWRRAESALATAQHEHERAQERFQETLGAVDQYYTTVSENRLLNQPGMLDLRKELLQSARDYYARFAEEQRDDPTVQAELGRALFCLASLTRDTGKPSQARELMQQALDVRQKLLQANPDSLQFQDLVCGTLNALANLYTETSQVSKALELHGQSLAMAQQLVQTHPEAAAGYLGIARSGNNLGLLHATMGKAAEAQSDYMQALTAARALVQKHPTRIHRREHIRICVNLSELHIAAGRVTEAVALYGEAAQLAKELARDYPKVIEYQALAAGSQISLLRYEALTAQQDERGSWQKLARLAVRIQEPLSQLGETAAANPNDAEIQRMLLRLLATNATLRLPLGQTAEAEAEYRRALTIAERLAGKDATLSVSIDNLGIHLGLCGLFLDKGQLDLALSEADAVQHMLGQIPAKVRPSVSRYQSLTDAYRGMAHFEQQKYAEAVVDWERAGAVSGEKYDAFCQASRLLAQTRAGEANTLGQNRDLLERACREAAEIQQGQLMGGSSCYWMALVHSASASAAGGDEKTANERAAQAVHWLERARNAGYFRSAGRIDRLAAEPLFAFLRQRADFRALVSSHLQHTENGTP